MPEMKHYVVTQTRSVRVTANNMEDAVKVAAAGFNNGQNSDNGVINGPAHTFGNTDTKIKTIRMTADED